MSSELIALCTCFPLLSLFYFYGKYAMSQPLLAYSYFLTRHLIGWQIYQLPSGTASLPNTKSFRQHKIDSASHSDGVHMLSFSALQWRHCEHDGVSNHRRLGSLLNRLFWRRPKKTSKLRVLGLCEGNPPVTGGFPSQGASNAENVSIWRHHRGLDGKWLLC